MARIRKSYSCPPPRRGRSLPLSPAAFFTNPCACPHRITPRRPRRQMPRCAAAVASRARAAGTANVTIRDPMHNVWKKLLGVAIFTAVALSLVWPLSEIISEYMVPPCPEPATFYGPKTMPTTSDPFRVAPNEDTNEVFSYIYESRPISPKFKMLFLDSFEAPEVLDFPLDGFQDYNMDSFTVLDVVGDRFDDPLDAATSFIPLGDVFENEIRTKRENVDPLSALDGASEDEQTDEKQEESEDESDNEWTGEEQVDDQNSLPDYLEATYTRARESRLSPIHPLSDHKDDEDFQKIMKDWEERFSTGTNVYFDRTYRSTKSKN